MGHVHTAYAQAMLQMYQARSKTSSTTTAAGLHAGADNHQPFQPPPPTVYSRDEAALGAPAPAAAAAARALLRALPPAQRGTDQALHIQLQRQLRHELRDAALLQIEAQAGWGSESGRAQRVRWLGECGCAQGPWCGWTCSRGISSTVMRLCPVHMVAWHTLKYEWARQHISKGLCRVTRPAVCRR